MALNARQLRQLQPFAVFVCGFLGGVSLAFVVALDLDGRWLVASLGLAACLLIVAGVCLAMSLASYLTFASYLPTKPSEETDHDGGRS